MKNISNKSIIILGIGLFSGIGLSALSILLTEQAHQAEAITIGQNNADDTRIFQLAHGIIDQIDPALYEDGTPVMAGSTGLPEIVIQHWSKIRIIDKASINSQALADNWEDVTCIVTTCI
jgi:hypothetical protein